MKYKLVYIEWKDPTYHCDRSIKNDWALITQRTGGLLVKEDKKYIRVALNIDEDGIGEYIDIPKCLIINEKRRTV